MGQRPGRTASVHPAGMGRSWRCPFPTGVVSPALQDGSRKPMETETTQFGVRPFGCLNGDPKRFEVFDRRTGNAVVSGLRRDEAEADARRRNHDRSGPTGMAVSLGPLEVAALRNAV